MRKARWRLWPIRRSSETSELENCQTAQGQNRHIHCGIFHDYGLLEVVQTFSFIRYHRYVTSLKEKRGRSRPSFYALSSRWRSAPPASNEPHDLLKFGIIPELVGRLPIIAPLASLKRLLMGMLAPALRRNVGHRTFQNFQQGLLYALSRDIPGNAGFPET